MDGAHARRTVRPRVARTRFTRVERINGFDRQVRLSQRSTHSCVFRPQTTSRDSSKFTTPCVTSETRGRDGGRRAMRRVLQGGGEALVRPAVPPVSDVRRCGVLRRGVPEETPPETSREVPAHSSREGLERARAPERDAGPQGRRRALRRRVLREIRSPGWMGTAGRARGGSLGQDTRDGRRRPPPPQDGRHLRQAHPRKRKTRPPRERGRGLARWVRTRGRRMGTGHAAQSESQRESSRGGETMTPFYHRARVTTRAPLAATKSLILFHRLSHPLSFRRRASRGILTPRKVSSTSRRGARRRCSDRAWPP